jgi:hypothetical protein
VTAAENATPLPDRLARLAEFSLRVGAHESLDEGACAMELVSFIAGEPWSDNPRCTCPVIAAFVRGWNDGLPSDADRDRLLKPLLPRLVGTRSTPDVEQRRSYLALDWFVRVYTPAWLDLVPTLAGRAAALRALPAIVDVATATQASPVVSAARAAAGNAAWDAARDAAGNAARAAARDAAWLKLSPTVTALQDSAHDLVKRMCEVQP